MYVFIKDRLNRFLPANIYPGTDMLFDLRIKTSKKELFNRDKELDKLYANIDKPIIIVTGIKRIGKTSLLNVFLNENTVPGIIIDLSELHINYGIIDLYKLFSKAFSQNLDKFIDIVKDISFIESSSYKIEFRPKDNILSLNSIFDTLNKKKTIIVFDETHRLRGPRQYDVLSSMAHAYDYDKNITLVLISSEPGFLYELLALDDAKSPLYGRYCYKLDVSKFSIDIAIEFLKIGFREAGVYIDKNILEKAVDIFDGIPGWLTFFGHKYINGVRDINVIKEMAIDIALQELKSIVYERSNRYGIVLKSIAEGMNSWSKLKRYIEEKEGISLSSSSLLNIIKNLENMGIIENYIFLDPVYREAALRL